MAPPAGPMPLLLSLRTCSPGWEEMNSSLPTINQGQHLSNLGAQENNAHRLGRTSSESIVAEVERNEVGEVEHRGAEGAKGLRDLRDEATREDVGKVGNLFV
jgi:hypothetical protein